MTGSRHNVNHSGEDGVCIVVRIMNLGRISEAYGALTATRAMDALRSSAPVICHEAAVAIGAGRALSIDRLSVQPAGKDSLFLFIPTDGERGSYAIFASELLAQIVAHPIAVGDANQSALRLRLLPDIRWWSAPSIDVERGELERKRIGEEGEFLCLACKGTIESERSKEEYRSDISISDAALEALYSGRVYLSWQPILHASSDCRARSVLYFEAISKIVNEEGEILPPGKYIRALERTGLIRAFDRAIALRVCEELEAAVVDVRLAFNVSALSATDDLWWIPLWKRLGNSPSVAKRLFVEITDGSAIGNLSRSAIFSLKLKQSKARIVFDCFGSGNLSIRESIIIIPDFMKISRIFLNDAPNSLRFPGVFESPASFCKSIGAGVVAKNIDSEAQLEFSINNGSSYFQGNLHSPPALFRPWVINPELDSSEECRAIQ